MIRRIVEALAFGIAATIAVQTLAPITKTPDYAMLQVWLSLCVSALVALGVALSN